MFIELIVGLNNPNTLEDTRVMSTQSVSHVLFLVFLSVFLVFMKIFVAHFWQHFCMFHYVLCPAPPGRIYYAVRRGFRSNSSTSIGGHGNDVVAILHPAVTRATYCQVGIVSDRRVPPKPLHCPKLRALPELFPTIAPCIRLHVS